MRINKRYNYYTKVKYFDGSSHNLSIYPKKPHDFTTWITNAIKDHEELISNIGLTKT